MIRYIPDFVLQNYEARILQGNLNAYVLLFDVADFTTISGDMQKHGKEGAEELSRFLDVVFGAPITSVQNYGGFVSLFAGDAFCAVFPDGKPEGVISAVNSIRAFFKDKTDYTCPLGEFSLKMRQTICCGSVDWQIYENELQNEYVFSGATMQELTELSTAKEDVVFSDDAALNIGLQHFEKLDTGYRLLVGQPNSDLACGETEFASPTTFCCESYNYAPATKAKFINPKYSSDSPQNEIRSAAYCFANLERIAMQDREQAISLIQSLADKYGGYVNKYDATDKGLTAIILFGLPRSEDKTLERICNFSLETVESNPDIALGISCGSVFAGYTGSGEVREFTALGAPMNLAARLMSKARPGEVLTDTFLWQEMNAHYDFDYLGSLNLKGIAMPVRYYHLSRQSKDKAWHQESRFVGRDEELAAIRELVDNSIANKENTIIYVSGDAGIGKSRLVKEALAVYGVKNSDSSLPNRNSATQCHKFFITCDAILSKPLDAIKQMIKAFFYYNPQLPEEAGIGMFRALWMSLALGDAEMQRIESIIVSLLGYEWSGSIWSVLPPEEKPNQLKHAFIRFIEQLTQTKPVLIHLDDGQWIDSESKAYLQALSEKEISPVIIVSPCRYLDNGNRADLELFSHKRADIDLNSLSDSGSNEMIKTILRLQQIPQATLSLITERAMGNPLFIEQLTSYLMECGSINDKGIITSGVGYLSSFSISDIISSRIDRLSEKVRECMFNASVLGMEFNIKVLSKMLNNVLTDELEAGVNNRIWKDMDELRYIFTHILIKDIVYQRMINEKLKALHQTAAEAMEVVYTENLNENAEDIARHYEKGGQILKAAVLYHKAGCWLNDNFIFDRAEMNIRKALSIRKTALGEEHPGTLDSLALLASIYHSRGDYKLAEPLLISALKSCDAHVDKEHQELRAPILNNLACLFTDQGNYEQAEKYYLLSLESGEITLGIENPDIAFPLKNLARLYSFQSKYNQALPLLKRVLEIREKAFGAKHPKTASAHCLLADLHRNMCDFMQAELLFQKALEIFDGIEKDEYTLKSHTLAGMASLYSDQKNFCQAESLLLEAVDIEEKAYGVDHPHTAYMLHNLADFYKTQGKYIEAEQLYLKILEIKEHTVGKYHRDSSEVLNNLALICQRQGRYAKAEYYFFEALDISERALGKEHSSTAKTMGEIASCFFDQMKYEQAEEFYLQALKTNQTSLGLNHPITVKILEEMVELYKRTKNTHKVAECIAMLPNKNNQISELTTMEIV
jgi:predicted ATPase/class 3 adenylate cyclase